MAKRILQIREFLTNSKIDALMIRSAAMKRWMDTLTGSGCTIVITQKGAYLIADGRYTTEAKEKEKDLQLIEIVQRQPYLEIVNQILNKDGCKNLAVEANETLAKQYLKLNELNIPIILLEDEIAGLRIMKDHDELLKLQAAADLGDRIYKKVLSQIRVGMSEFEISALLQYYAISSGAQGMSFNTIVATGERTALPHGRPTARTVKPHEPIMMDFGVQLDNYQSDMTRICCIGEPIPEIQKIYTIVAKAQQKGVDSIREGAIGKEVDAAVRSVITEAGYGEYFNHGLGHGIGVDDSTEGPVLNQKSSTILHENMVMSCEPGIYVPGIGGIRIEDMVQIKNGIGIPMTHTTKELIILKER